MTRYHLCRAFVLSTLALAWATACTSPPSAKTPPTTVSTKTAAFDPVKSLAGGWHNDDFNVAGATKRFTPSAGDSRHGRADGFWPTGGVYKVLASDATARTLRLQVQTAPDADPPAQSLVASITFIADGKHLTWEKLSGSGGPEGKLVFYRAP